MSGLAQRTKSSIGTCLPMCLALGLLVPTSQASAATQAKTLTASEGSTQATLTYQQAADSFGNPTFSEEQLTIVREGTTYYRQPVKSRYCADGCLLESPAETLAVPSDPLSVRDLEGDGQPEVVLELNSGGAHCCSIVQVYQFDPGVSAYRPIERDFGDSGVLLTDLTDNGRLEFESSDDRFAYEFTSYAYAGLPLQILAFRGGRFVDVTRSFPQLIAVDAERQHRAFLANRRPGYGLGFIAAWAADEYLLGHRSKVAKLLAREARARRLRSADRLSPTGSAFIAKLKRFLHKTGYS